jgi:CRISPR-associated protein Cmr1
MRKINNEMKAFAQTDVFKEQLADKKLNVKDTSRITQTRKYKLITPLFGGGVTPKEADPIKVIRETSIRGQLRFWWRAMRGVGTLEEMKKREDLLFGSGGEKASQSKILITIKVNGDGKIDNEGRSEEPFYVNNSRSRPTGKWESIAYAAFPLQPANDELHLPMKSIRLRVEFTIKISFPGDAATKKDVEAALWAWETFGGIGGRTRRGFGALQLAEVDGVAIEPMKIEEIKPEKGESRIVRELKEQLATGTWDENVPHLSDNLSFALTPVFTSTHSGENNLLAWEFLIHKLHDFRQSPRIGRIHNGESHWTEPDSIRNKIPTRTFRQPDNKELEKFPRAVLGLPIVFKFKDGEGDPPETILEGFDAARQKINRLASPLILRPIACQDGAVGLALVLESPRIPPEDVWLYVKSNRSRKWRIDKTKIFLDSAEAGSIAPINEQLSKLTMTTPKDWEEVIFKAFLESVKA